MSQVSRQRSDSEDRKLPAWLVGLLIAAVLFLIGLVVFQALGFGDNPVLDPNAFPNAWGPESRLWAAENTGSPAHFG